MVMRPVAVIEKWPDDLTAEHRPLRIVNHLARNAAEGRAMAMRNLRVVVGDRMPRRQ